MEHFEKCPYQKSNSDRFENIESKVSKLEDKVNKIDRLQEGQERDVKHIFELLSNLTGSVARIEQALNNREDSFKKALYEVGMFVFKASLTCGSLIWIYFKLGGVALF